MATETLTRKELYDLVWSTPFTILSKKYSISDVGLKKTCKRMEIPTPISGHWTKVKSNLPVKVLELPTDYSGKASVVLILRETGPSPTDFLEDEIKKTMGHLLIVSDRLSKPHKLISEAKERLTQKPKFHSEGMVYTHAGEIPVEVAPANVGRALRFLDTFIKILIERGHDIIIKDDSTYIVVFGEEMKISFKERLKKIKKLAGEKYPTESYEYVPSGTLTFTVKVRYSYTLWCLDGKSPIEQKLAQLLASIEISAKEMKDSDTRRENERLIQEEKIRKLREFENLKERELLNFKRLLQEAKQWQEAELLRSYFNFIESKNNLTEEMKGLIAWGRKKANWYDPQMNSSDELLKHANKESLTYIKKIYWDWE